MEEKRIVVLSGPTASGKTATALALARLFPFEIVSADAMQVFRGMDIGTAKPSPQERAAVPHHLIDVADPDEHFSAGRFVAEAEKVVADIRARGRFPLLVGGSGMYLRAFLCGLDPLPSEPTVRAELALRLEAEGGGQLHAELRRIDPASAERIHPRDKVRIVRALEIALLTGERPSARRLSWAGRRYRVLFLAIRLPREELYRRIDARVDRMFAEGFLAEVERLLSAGYSRRLKSMSSLGYRHAVAHLLDGVPLEAAAAAMKRDTRRYAKRQITWLSREPGVKWLDADLAVAGAAESAKNFLA